MKKLVLLVSAVALASACTPQSRSNSSSNKPADSSGSESKPNTSGLDPRITQSMTTQPEAKERAEDFLKQVEGKKFVFAGESSRTIDDGKVIVESSKTAEECLVQKEIKVTDSTGKVIRTEPMDDITGLTFHGMDTAIEETQTSAGKPIYTAYSIDNDGDLNVNLIESGDNKILFKMGGKIILEGDTLKLRINNKVYSGISNGEAVEAPGQISQRDVIFKVQEN